MIVQSQRYCPGCQRWTLHAKYVESAAWGCLTWLICAGVGYLLLGPVGLFTGVFLTPVLLGMIALCNLATRYRCQSCGRN